MPVKILPLYWGGIFFVLLFWVEVWGVFFRAKDAGVNRKVREGYSLRDTLCVLCDTLCSKKIFKRVNLKRKSLNGVFKK